MIEPVSVDVNQTEAINDILYWVQGTECVAEIAASRWALRTRPNENP